MDWGTVGTVFGVIVGVAFIATIAAYIVSVVADYNEALGAVVMLIFLASAVALFFGWVSYKDEQRDKEYQEIIDGIKRYPIDDGIYGELPGEEHSS